MIVQENSRLLIITVEGLELERERLALLSCSSVKWQVDI